MRCRTMHEKTKLRQIKILFYPFFLVATEESLSAFPQDAALQNHEGSTRHSLMRVIIPLLLPAIRTHRKTHVTMIFNFKNKKFT